MKKVLLAVLLLVSVKSMAIGTIKGNGIYKKESRSIAAFSGLASSGQMNVEISYGVSSDLQIEGDENILPYVETFVKNGVLKIRVKDLTIIKPQLTIKVKISMTIISSISQSGSGSVQGDGGFTNSEPTDFSISGSGKIRLGFANFKGTNISMSGIGTLQLKGHVNEDISIHQSGSGNIDCENMPCQNASVNISGSGNVRLNARESINAHISGSGEIFYTGDAGRLDSHISGSGKIRKI